MLHWREFTPAVVAMVTGQQARPQTDGESVDFARGGTMAPTRPSPGHLTVEQLQTFAVIARSESFRKAAEDLF